MSEQYLQALSDETLAWEELEGLLRQQCQSIIRREADRVSELQEPLRERVRLALLARDETARLRPEQSLPEGDALTQQLQRARQRAQDALRLNRELLVDVCSYVEMIREVVAPQALPPRYGSLRLENSPQISTEARVA